MLVEQAAARGVDLDTATVPLRRVASPHALGYRWRARFQSGFGDRAPTIGFHGRGHWRVVDVPECPLLAPPLAAAYRAMRDALFRLAPPDLTGFELTVIPHAPGALLTLNPRDVPPATWPAIGEALLADEACGLAGIAVSPPRGDPRPALLGAPSILGRTPAGRPVAVAARGFLQSNLAAGDLLADEVARMVGAASRPRVLELYAGSGFLSWPMAAAGARVEAFEDSDAAVRAAARLPDPAAPVLPPAAPGGSLVLASGEARAIWRARGGEPWDVLVADPPRTGLGPLAREVGANAAEAPPQIVLVSCSLAAVARDLAALAAHGYRPAEIVQVDMFPQTRHAETVVRLQRAGRVADAGLDRRVHSNSSRDD
jgi:tRNA/tmRNA/rRNA uracil-C5-methylase (TrmA/RlmC/RlmD family)